MTRRSLPLAAAWFCVAAGCVRTDRPGRAVDLVSHDTGHFRVSTSETAAPPARQFSPHERLTRPDAPLPTAEAAPIRLAAFEPGVTAVPPAPEPEPGTTSNDAAAPAAPAVQGPFTVDEFERLALANNPSLRQAASAVGKARGLHRQVGLYPNPTAGYQANEVGNSQEAGQQGAFLSQTIVTGDKLDLNRSVASWEIQSTQWEAEAQRMRVVNGVRTQFYQTLGAQRRVEIAKELLRVAEAGEHAAAELERAGQVARPDVLQARIQLNEVRVTLRNAEVDYDASWRQLAAVVGCPELPRTDLAGALDDGASPRDVETVIAEVCAASPELQAARARVARARAQIARQEAQPVPNVQLQVGGAHDFSTGDPIANVQIGMPIPVFNRNQGNVDIARNEYYRAVHDLRRLELELRSRAAVALREYGQARSQVGIYRDEILPAAKENLQLTEAGYERGEFDLIRALQARRSFFEANLALVSSQVALRQSDVALSGLLLTGGLNEVPDSTAGTLVDLSLRDLATGGQQ